MGEFVYRAPLQGCDTSGFSYFSLQPRDPNSAIHPVYLHLVAPNSSKISTFGLYLYRYLYRPSGQ
jgi:hypothetical protein